MRAAVTLHNILHCSKLGCWAAGLFADQKLEVRTPGPSPADQQYEAAQAATAVMHALRIARSPLRLREVDLACLQ